MKKFISCLMASVFSLVCFCGMTAAADENGSMLLDEFYIDSYDVDNPSVIYENGILVKINRPNRDSGEMAVTLECKTHGYNRCVASVYSIPTGITDSGYKLIVSRPEYYGDDLRRISYWCGDLFTDVDIFTCVAQANKDYDQDVCVYDTITVGTTHTSKFPVFYANRFGDSSYAYNNKYRITLYVNGDLSDYNVPFSLFGHEYNMSDIMDSSYSINPNAPESRPLCGDTDDDGRVSISDSIILNRYLAGTVEALPCSDPPPLAPEDNLE